MSIRNRSRAASILGRPLVCAGRALGQFPLITEQVFQVVVVPLSWFGGPCAFQAAGDRGGAIAVAKGVLPAEALLFNPGALGFGANVFVRIGSAVGLAEGMAAGNQREGLLVIHRHAAEGLADIPYRSGWIRLSIGSFRVHVNQAHLHRAERIVELTIALIAFVPQPLALRTPEDVLLRYPHVLAAAAEAEGFQAHRIQRDISGQNHKIGPRDLLAILLLDGPEQPARLIEAHIVRPAVEGRKTLCAHACPAAAVADAVGACAVPRHANEERPVVAIIRRPPGLRARHQLV